MPMNRRFGTLIEYKRFIARVLEIESRDLTIDEIMENGPETIIPLPDKPSFVEHLEQLGFILDEAKANLKFCEENLEILKLFQRV